MLASVRILAAFLVVSAIPFTQAAEPALNVTATLAATEAVQAAAADARFIYAVNNTKVAKYDRATGERVAASTGPASHLNSAFVWEGKVYCAHSNYPKKPEHSEIKVLDPATMALTTFHDFGESDGSLTWAVREGGHWWCTFAFYKADNARTRLVKFDEAWRPLQAWTYPAEVIRELGEYSISGGEWHDGHLLATGHDRRVIYRLRVPPTGDVLELRDTLQSPFPGQGIAADPKKANGFIGIDRAKKQVVFAELR